MHELLPCRESIRASLASEALRLSGRLSIRVFGTSMLPTVWPGDVLIFEPCRADDLRPCEIILYQRDERLIVHRLVGISRNGDQLALLTRGDGQRHSDLPVLEEAVLGRAILIQREGRAPCPLPARQSLLQRLFSWMATRFTLFSEFALRVHSSCTWLASRFLRLPHEKPQATVETQN
jgi:signal peptidase I